MSQPSGLEFLHSLGMTLPVNKLPVLWYFSMNKTLTKLSESFSSHLTIPHISTHPKPNSRRLPVKMLSKTLATASILLLSLQTITYVPLETPLPFSIHHKYSRESKIFIDFPVFDFFPEHFPRILLPSQPRRGSLLSATTQSNANLSSLDLGRPRLHHHIRRERQMPKLKLRLCQADQLGVVAECIGEIDDTGFKVAM